MPQPAESAPIVRFGPFEADLHTRELRKQGIRIRLQEQPFQILAMLLERPGELVTRDEIRANLWPEDTFVDFDHGLNAAVRRLRDALNDSADTPRYIETLPRRGYRFIGPVEASARGIAAVISEEPPPVGAVTTEPVVAGQHLHATNAEASAAPGTIPPPVARSARKQWLIATATVCVLFGAAILGRRFYPGSSSIDSIAILPFNNETKQSDLDYLAGGITDAIITNLAEAPSLRVISQNAAAAYKRRNLDLKTVAHELGVRAVLVGTVARAAPASTRPEVSDDVRIAVELVDTKDDRRLWGEQYVIKPLQMNGTQSEISDRITEKLALRLTPAVKERVRGHHTENNQAFDSYLRGRYIIDTRKGSLRQALNYFEDALRLDPKYAMAYTGEAAACGLMSFYGEMPPAEAYPREQVAIQHALQLDPQSADAHMQQGYLLQALHHDFAGAEREYLRARELQPYSGGVHHALALHYAITQRPDEAAAEAKRAAELEPFLPISAGTELWVAYFGHNFRQHVEGDEFDAACTGAMMHEALGEYPEAIREMEKVQWQPGLSCSLPHLYAVAGRRNEAELIVNQMIAARRQKYTSAYQIALVYAGLGDAEKMLRWLDAANRELDPWLNWIKVDPRFDPYRNLPAFQAIEQRTFTPR